MSIPIPTELTFGHVAGRYITIVKDTLADPDSKPDAVAETGSITFTPVTTQLVSTSLVPTLVTRSAKTFSLDSEGYLADTHGNRHVELVTGVYQVSYALSKAKVTSHLIEVTEAHTSTDPLWLPVAAPYVPPSGVQVTTMQVPLGASAGQYLGWDGTRLNWLDGSGGGGGTTDHALLSNRELDDQHPITAITGLEAALSDLQPAGNYALEDHDHNGVYQPAGDYAAQVHGHVISDVTGLQTALDDKQPAGSYASATHNHDGTYQPAGSYASATHNHDGTYQPAGSYAPALHGHTISDVTGLDTTLSEKADSGHGHAISDVTGLDTALSEKADSAHTHDDRYFTETEADGRFVRTVNGTGPDGAGDVTVESGAAEAYLPNPRADQTYPFGRPADLATQPGVDQFKFYVQDFPIGVTIAYLGIHVRAAAAAGAGQPVELALYRMDTGDQICSVVAPGTAMEATGHKWFAVSATIPPGLIAFGTKARGTPWAGDLRRDSSDPSPYASAGNTWDGISASNRGMSVPSAGTGAAPTNIATLTISGGSNPVAMGYRAAQ